MQPEPIFDLAHLGHMELFTPKPEESLKFFVLVMGMTATARQGDSVYLRGWDGRAVPSTPSGSLRTDAGSIGVFADLATVKPPSRAAMLAADGPTSGRVPKGPA